MITPYSEKVDQMVKDGVGHSHTHTDRETDRHTDKLQ